VFLKVIQIDINYVLQIVILLELKIIIIQLEFISS